MVKAGHTMEWSKTPTCINMTPDGHRVEKKFFLGNFDLSCTCLGQHHSSKTETKIEDCGFRVICTFFSSLLHSGFYGMSRNAPIKWLQRRLLFCWQLMICSGLLATDKFIHPYNMLCLAFPYSTATVTDHDKIPLSFRLLNINKDVVAGC